MSGIDRSNKAVYMDELIRRHGKIMDEYDPLKKIGMIVDEWGGCGIHVSRVQIRDFFISRIRCVMHL